MSMTDVNAKKYQYDRCEPCMTDMNHLLNAHDQFGHAGKYRSDVNHMHDWCERSSDFDARCELRKFSLTDVNHAEKIYDWCEPKKKIV